MKKLDPVILQSLRVDSAEYYVPEVSVAPDTDDGEPILVLRYVDVVDGEVVGAKEDDGDGEICLDAEQALALAKYILEAISE